MKTFKELCREDTGRHFLDSGGAYGRHHEKPPIPVDQPIAAIDGIWGSEVSAVIHTGAWLDECMEIKRGRQAKFEKFADREENRREPWDEILARYADRKGWLHLDTINTYNGEQDLDQTLLWHIYSRTGEHIDEWYHADHDDLAIAVQTHNGCDVRGGYSRPVFCASNSGGFDYPIPLDYVAGFYPIAAHDPDGEEIDDLWMIPQVDRWSTGYSSWPTGELRDSIQRVFGWTRTVDTVCVLTNTGHKVKIAVEAPHL